MCLGYALDWCSNVCSVLQISGGVSLMPIMDPVDAADAIVSYYPEFAGFGEFNDLGSGTCQTLSLCY